MFELTFCISAPRYSPYYAHVISKAFMSMPSGLISAPVVIFTIYTHARRLPPEERRAQLFDTRKICTLQVDARLRATYTCLLDARRRATSTADPYIFTRMSYLPRAPAHHARLRHARRRHPPYDAPPPLSMSRQPRPRHIAFPRARWLMEKMPFH